MTKKETPVITLLKHMTDEQKKHIDIKSFVEAQEKCQGKIYLTPQGGKKNEND